MHEIKEITHNFGRTIITKNTATVIKTVTVTATSLYLYVTGYGKRVNPLIPDRRF